MLAKLISVIYLAVFVNYALSQELYVKTSSGTVRGIDVKVLNRTVRQFLGIPYAEPPIGELRFAKPKPLAKPRPLIIDGTQIQNSCMQVQSRYLKYITKYSEDCLFVNVWSPDSKTTELKPVLFWIHGGGLSEGSSYEAVFNGSALATNDVIVTSANYRLGSLGFFYGGDESAPGNQGLYDQLLALKWVNENIHLFGGDKDKITIFGESAGSFSVSAHLTSPLSKGLFRRAIMQSGASINGKLGKPQPKEEVLANSKKAAEKLKCVGNEWLECLRNVSAEEIIRNGGRSGPMEGTEFLPLTAQEAFKQMKFNSDLDVMAGVCHDEGAAFASEEQRTKNVTTQDFLAYIKQSAAKYLKANTNITAEDVLDVYMAGVDPTDTEAIRRRIYDFVGDAGIKCGTYQMAKQYALHSKDKSKVFFYELTRYPIIPKNNPMQLDPEVIKKLGVVHAIDNYYVFGFPLIFNWGGQVWQDQVDLKFSKQYMKLWTNFAKYGKPDADKWKPLITGTDSPTLVRDLRPEAMIDPEFFADLWGKTCDGLFRDYFE